MYIYKYIEALTLRGNSKRLAKRPQAKNELHKSFEKKKEKRKSSLSFALCAS